MNQIRAEANAATSTRMKRLAGARRVDPTLDGKALAWASFG